METPTSEEKILAALAHASVLFSFLGPVGPSLIWANQRDKSKYVRFHALQAMGYQAFLYWAWFIGIFVIFFGCIFLMAILSVTLDPSWLESPVLPLLFQPFIFLGIFGLMGLFFLTGIAGAVLCMLDRKFRYPIIGNWLERKLLNEQHVETGFEEWEDSWVSSVCHSTAIIQFWGVITPLILWFSQKGRSAKIRFQALQAVFYQLAAVIAYMAGAGTSFSSSWSSPRWQLGSAIHRLRMAESFRLSWDCLS